MVEDNGKRKRNEENKDSIIASIPISKKRALSKIVDAKEIPAANIPLTRRDTVHRRVSTSFDQSTLELEDQLFSPPPKLDEKRKKSIHGRHSLTSDSDSSLSITQDILLPTSYNSFSTDDFQNKEEFKIPDFTTEIVNVDDSLLCDEEDIDDDLYSIAIIKSLPPYDSLSSSLLKHNLLPDRQSTACEYTMILDLDETLAHCVMEPIEKYDQKFDIKFCDDTFTVFASFRPFLQEFLEEVSKMFEIVVFTASQPCYADKLLDLIDPKKLVSYRLYREHCLFVDDNYLKDLRSLNRDLKKTVIVDNSVYAFGYYLDNGIPIKSYFDDKNDRELRDILPFLRSLIGVEDVRKVLGPKFNLESIINSCPLCPL